MALAPFGWYSGRVQPRTRQGEREDRTRKEPPMATSTATRKRTTLADLIAAAALGAIDPSTEVVTAGEADDAARIAASDAIATAAIASTAAYAAYTGTTGEPAPLSATDHDCAIPGCRHGAAHGPTQPDRQVKLACTSCGAVARMTASALRKARIIICGDGTTFAVAPRRTYTRKV